MGDSFLLRFQSKQAVAKQVGTHQLPGYSRASTLVLIRVWTTVLNSICGADGNGHGAGTEDAAQSDAGRDHISTPEVHKLEVHACH